MLNKKRIPKKFWDCIEYMMNRFISDTMVLVDNVLTDSIEDPQFSANKACYKLDQIVFLEKTYWNKEYKTIWKYLRSCGYTEEDITLLKQKCIEEDNLVFDE